MNKKNKLELFGCFLFSYVIILALILIGFINDFYAVTVISWAVLFSYLSLLYIILNKTNYNYMHPLCLFSYTFGLFICNRYILNAASFADIRIPNFMGVGIIDDESIFITGIIIILFIFSYTLSCLILNVKNLYFNLEQLDILTNIGFICMFVGIVPALFIQYKIASNFMSGNYIDIFSGAVSYNPPLLLKLLSVFYRLGFFIILVSIPKNKKFFYALILYTPFIILNLMTGVRGYYFSLIIILFFYYSVFIKKENFKFHKILIIFMLTVFLGGVIGNLRLGLPLFNQSIFIDFIFDQGTSVLSVIYGYQAAISHMIDATYLNYFDRLFQPDNMLQDKVDLIVNSEAKSYGLSLGGSILQEAFLIGGYIQVVIIGATIPIVINYMLNRSYHSRLWLLILLLSLTNLIFSPRSRFFDFLISNYSYFILFYIIIGLYNKYGRKS